MSKHVHELQCFGKFCRRAIDPVIHGVAAGEADALHLAAHVGLQCRLDVGQEEKVGVFVLLGDAGLKSFEDVEVGVVGFRFVEVVGIGSAPAECLALRALDAAGVDVVLMENLFLLGAEIFADDGHDADLR